MRLVRAWPSRPPSGRNYVVDDAERVPVDDYDYRALVDVGDDVLLLDWDQAAHREDLAEFSSRARCEPGRVLVAPVSVYPDSRMGLSKTVWNCRRYDGQWLRYVETGEPTCHLFGFGMVYLPRDLIIGFVEANPAAKLDDTSFSGWLYRQTGQDVPIAWDVRPVHLHYRISDVVT